MSRSSSSSLLQTATEGPFELEPISRVPETACPVWAAVAVALLFAAYCLIVGMNQSALWLSSNRRDATRRVARLVLFFFLLFFADKVIVTFSIAQLIMRDNGQTARRGALSNDRRDRHSTGHSYANG